MIVDTDELRTATEVAAALGWLPSNVSNARVRYADFPAPVFEHHALGGRQGGVTLYLWPEVDAWAELHGIRERSRKRLAKRIAALKQA
jgi:hypothetical protein